MSQDDKCYGRLMIRPMNPHQQLAAWLTESKCNGILVTKPENIGYLTGFWGSFGVYLQTPKGQFLLTDGRYKAVAESLAKAEGFEFVLFEGTVPEKFVSQVSGPLWVEDTLSIAEFKRYRRWFKGSKLKAQAGAVESLRKIKSASELKIMKAAQTHVDAVLIPFLKENLQSGITELALKFKLDQVLQHSGQYDLSFDSIVGFAASSALPHYVSGDRKLKPGDNILIDCGVVHRHYCSDMTRNFVFGPAKQNYLKDYETLLQVQCETLSKVKTGVKAKNLDAFARENLGSLSEYFTHSLGHGVGLEIHEAPTLSARSKNILQTGEVVTIEPGIYKPENYGIRIEDTTIVQLGGNEVLTKTTKDLLSFDEAGQVQIIVRAA